MVYQQQLAVKAVRWYQDKLEILDQRKLPASIEYQYYDNAEGVAEAITTMQVRGAPAIGIAAAYGVYLSVREHFGIENKHWRERVEQDCRLLAQARPTAVNLFWALQQMQFELDKGNEEPLHGLLARAKKIHQDDIDANYKMGQYGAEVIGTVNGVLTHCNAGALATGGYGTALGVIRSGYNNGITKVYIGETRPWLQGARLTAWELQQEGIPATLIADSAAAWLMRSGKIEWIIVGADRIASNGDVANKIGTYSLAVLAQQHRVKLMVVAPMSTVDWHIKDGSEIMIEHRHQDEIIPPSLNIGNAKVDAWNPVFDITPVELITAIVTDRGVVINPAQIGIKSLKND